MKEAAARANMKDASMRQLKHIMCRLTKGELGTRLLSWRTLVREEKRIDYITRLKREALEQATWASRRSALRQLAQVMARIVKGQLGTRVATWRTVMKDKARAGQVASACKSSAVREMSQIMARMVKRELGRRVEAWRGATRDGIYIHHLAQLQCDLQDKATKATKSTATQQLMQIACRLLKGDLGLRVQLWRIAVHEALMEARLEQQRALEKVPECVGHATRSTMSRIPPCTKQAEPYP